MKMVKAVKARKKTGDPKTIKQNIQGQNGLKHVIDASNRVLVKRVLRTDVEYTLTKHAMKVV